MFYDYDEHVDAEDIAPVQPLENGGWVCAFDSSWDVLRESTAVVQTRDEFMRELGKRGYHSRISTYAVRQYRRWEKLKRQQGWIALQDMRQEQCMKDKRALARVSKIRAEHMRTPRIPPQLPLFGL